MNEQKRTRPDKATIDAVIGAQLDRWTLAKRIAQLAHGGQLRKITGEPYIMHLERVALRMSGIEATMSSDSCMAAWLHDVIEDTGWTQQDLAACGVPNSVRDIVFFLTHRPGENYLDYLLRLRQSEAAVKIKLADLQDNLQDWPEEGSLKDKWRLAYWFLSGGTYPPA